MEVNFSVVGKNKDRFFDRAAVAAMTTRKERAMLSKAGAYVRRRAITSIRRRKKPSQPGSPPHAHSRDGFATLKNILFYYDEKNARVIIGPRLLNGNKPHGSNRETVPELLEKGGYQTVEEWFDPWEEEWEFGVTKARRGAYQTSRRRATYAPRPFMGPALEAEANAGTLTGLYVRG